MSIMRCLTQGVDFPWMKELDRIVNPCGCANIHGCFSVDGKPWWTLRMAMVMAMLDQKITVAQMKGLTGKVEKMNDG